MLEPNQLSVTRPQGEAEIAPAPVAVRSDSVLPERLGMPCVRSEDSVRRAVQRGEDDQPYTDWTRKQLAASYEPLLSEPWILDMDATVKPLYGHPEAAVKGYNPRKPGW